MLKLYNKFWWEQAHLLVLFHVSPTYAQKCFRHCFVTGCKNFADKVEDKGNKHMIIMCIVLFVVVMTLDNLELF